MDLRPAVDAEVFDQQSEKGFRLPWVCLGDGALELVGDGFKVGPVGRRGGLCGELLGEFGILPAEGVEARFEGGHARLEATAVEIAILECLVVPVEGALGAADLLGERVSAFFQGGSRGLLTGGSLVDRSADERSVAVERGELLEHGAIEHGVDGFEPVGSLDDVAYFARQRMEFLKRLSSKKHGIYTKSPASLGGEVHVLGVDRNGVMKTYPKIRGQAKVI